MMCFMSLIFVFTIVGQLENNYIEFGQAIFYLAYGLIMFWHTSKPYWSENQKKGGKK